MCKGVRIMNKFSNYKKFSKPVIKKLSNDSPIIYEVANKNKEIIYAGIAKRNRGQERLIEHKDVDTEKIPGAKYFRIKVTKTVEVAKKEEKKIIKKVQPKYNIKDKK